MPGEVHHIGDGKDQGHPHGGSTRRLAAILAADIAGYSRLMGIDEEGTHARVKRHRRELIDPTIAEHHGRLVKNTGDGFLVMFDSPVEAVRCAIVIQQSMVGRNAALPPAQWIRYRIGVNLGDVIVEPDDIYGDGVNIAARLEGLAEPGAVYISGGIYEQIKNKLVCGYQPLGDQRVKNITDPVSVYRVLPDPAAVARARARAAIPFLILLLVAVVVIAGAAWYYFDALRPLEFAVRTPVSPTPPPASSTSGPAVSLPSAEQSATAPISPPPSPPAAQPAPTPTPEPPAALSKPAETSPTVPMVAMSPPPRSTVSPIKEPEMIALPGGTFAMGSNDDPSEKPIHHVTIKPFALGKYPVTVREWRQCVTAKGCDLAPIGEDDAPVSNVSWSDAQAFIAWLSRVSHKDYRLPSEAEWEYAARGGAATKYWWGSQFQVGMANCRGCNDPYDPREPLPVGSFKPNPFGLHDMGGGVDQWVADCWHNAYHGAPAEGTPWIDGDCSNHVLRGGSWKNDPSYTRPSNRNHYDTDVRYPTHGFRLALSQ